MSVFVDQAGSLAGSAVNASSRPSAEKAIRSPFGDQIGPETSMGNLVSWRASPPSMGSSQTWAEPPRLEVKAIVFPSGLHRGWSSLAAEVVNRFGSTPSPSVETSQR